MVEEGLRRGSQFYQVFSARAEVSNFEIVRERARQSLEPLFLDVLVQLGTNRIIERYDILSTLFSSNLYGLINGKE